YLIGRGFYLFFHAEDGIPYHPQRVAALFSLWSVSGADGIYSRRDNHSRTLLCLSLRAGSNISARARYWISNRSHNCIITSATEPGRPRVSRPAIHHQCCGRTASRKNTKTGRGLPGRQTLFDVWPDGMHACLLSSARSDRHSSRFGGTGYAQ